MILLDKNGNPPKSFDKRLENLERTVDELVHAHNANTKLLGAIIAWVSEPTKGEEDAKETAE